MGEFMYDYVGLEQEIGHSVDTNGAVEGGSQIIIIIIIMAITR